MADQNLINHTWHVGDLISDMLRQHGYGFDEVNRDYTTGTRVFGINVGSGITIDIHTSNPQAGEEPAGS